MACGRPGIVLSGCADAGPWLTTPPPPGIRPARLGGLEPVTYVPPSVRGSQEFRLPLPYPASDDQEPGVTRLASRIKQDPPPEGPPRLGVAAGSPLGDGSARPRECERGEPVDSFPGRSCLSRGGPFTCRYERPDRGVNGRCALRRFVFPRPGFLQWVTAGRVREVCVTGRIVFGALYFSCARKSRRRGKMPRSVHDGEPVRDSAPWPSDR